MSAQFNVVVCGGGNGAHTLAGIISCRGVARVTVLDVYQNEAEEWTRTLAEKGFRVNFPNGKSLYQKPRNVNFNVTKSAETCVPEADIVVICVPAFAHDLYLNLVSSYLKMDCMVVGMPGHPGFEYQCVAILKTLKKQNTVVSFETLPWACRIARYGEEVCVVGTKEEVLCSVVYMNVDKKSGGQVSDPLPKLQQLLGDSPVLRHVGSVIECTLLTKSTLHPPLMFAKWSNWDGQPLKETPLFYQGVDQNAVDILDDVNNEVMEMADAIAKQYPELGLPKIPSVQQWLIHHYGEQIEDKTTLLSCLKTNKAYNGLLHPTKKTADGHFLPDFSYRYTTEDVPYGLLVLREIAGMVGVSTPIIDKIITWAEPNIGVHFLDKGEICDIDRSQARLLRSFGIVNASDLISL